MKWDLKVSCRGPTNNFRNKSQNNVDRIKDGQDVFDEVSFDKVCIVLWCMKNCTTFWLVLDIKTLAGGQVVGARRTLQLPDITLTSKPWLETRSLVLGRWYNSLTVSRHQIPAFKPIFGALIGWLVVLGLAALWDSISVYIGPSPKEREKEERKDRGE